MPRRIEHHHSGRGTAVTPGGGFTASVQPFQTTVQAAAPGALTLASPVTTPVSGATYWCGQDATAGVTQAIAYAAKTGRRVTGSGAYWLASQTTPINLSGVAIQRDGAPATGFMPYTQTGLVFLITNTASAPFIPGVGATFEATAFWPLQDGSTVAPLAYPALFDVPAAGLITNFALDKATLVNPYRVLSIEPSGGGGRIFVSNTRAFCIDRCFDIRNGLADTIQTDNTDYFGPGVYGDIAPVGNAYLQRYTESNGEVFHLDPGAAGNNYPNVDGLLVSGGIFQGMRYAVRLISGVLDVSKVDGVDLDSVATALSVEGSAYAILPWTGGQIYSAQGHTPAAAPDVFSINTSNEQTDLTVSGVKIPYAQGTIVFDHGFGLGKLSFTGNNVATWGATSANTGITYYAVQIGNNPVNAVVSGNLMACQAGTAGNAWSGILLGSVRLASVTGNNMSNCAAAITLVGGTGAYSVFGNASVATYGPHSLLTTLSGTATLVGGNTTNNFDVP